MSARGLLFVALAISLGCKNSGGTRVPPPVGPAPSPIAQLPPPIPPGPPVAASGVQPPKCDDVARAAPPMPPATGAPASPPSQIVDPAITLVSATVPAANPTTETRVSPPPLPAAPTAPVAKPPETTDAPPPKSVKAVDSLQALIGEAEAKYGAIAAFEARLIKREVVRGDAIPPAEIEYRFRREPLSVYMKVVSEAGRGRECLYVKGQFGGKMHVVSGKGDSALVAAGFKTTLDPDSRMATSKSRYRVYEAGFGRSISGAKKAMALGTAKALGPVTRPEYPYPLDAVEVTLRPGDDPLFPKGGTRQLYFDANPESPSYRLPVLVVACEPDRREVEYYCFDRFRPIEVKAADWTPEVLGRK